MYFFSSTWLLIFFFPRLLARKWFFSNQDLGACSKIALQNFSLEWQMHFIFQMFCFLQILVKQPIYEIRQKTEIRYYRFYRIVKSYLKYCLFPQENSQSIYCSGAWYKPQNNQETLNSCYSNLSYCASATNFTL